MLSDSKYKAHTNPFFKSLNLLKIHDIYYLNVLKFYLFTYFIYLLIIDIVFCLDTSES